MQTTPIRILSEAPIQQIWTHLSRWESVTNAAALIQAKAGDVEVPMLDEKARALAYCLRNAAEYMHPTPPSWAHRVVGDYYGLMWFLSAALVAEPKSKYALSELEEATARGHGLANVDDAGRDFPGRLLVVPRASGFLATYLKHYLRLPKDVRSAALVAGPAKALDDIPEEEHPKLHSLNDLLARVPEITAAFVETTGEAPRAFRVWSSERNMSDDAIRELMRRRRKDKSEPLDVWIRVDVPFGFDEEALNRSGLPMREWSKVKDGIWEGKLTIAAGHEHWGHELNPYRSAMSGAAWIEPLSGPVDDVLVTHFMILYLLGILVRYRPATWREVTEGAHDAYRPLLQLYLETFERTAPQIALERITGRRVEALQPGSWNAPL